MCEGVGMRLMERLLEPTKNYINFPDLLFNLSSINNESLWDVVEYLDCKGLDALNVFSLGPRYEILSERDSQEIIYNFLGSIRSAIPSGNFDWVLTDVNSLDRLNIEAKNELVSLFDAYHRNFFKISELLSFEPLNGLLHFEDSDVKRTVKDESIENPIDRLIEEEHRKYISVSNFVDRLGKSESIGSGKPLKITLKQLFENTSLSNVKLYRLKNLNYALVSQTDNLKYKNSDELLRCFYDVLNNEQIGTISSDREPFKDFYFEYSEVEYIGASGSKLVEKEQPGYIDKQSPTNDRKLLESRSVINNLGENQRLLITYPSFVEEDIACLIIDENPACISHNDNYLRHSRMISKAISGGLLVPDDEGQIPAKQVKTWLASHNFIYKGFNDGTPNNTSKAGKVNMFSQQLADAQAQIVQITTDYNGAQLKIKALESELKKANTALADMPDNSVKHSNTDMHNIKKVAIKQFNRSLAMALIDLDYKGSLRKGDIVKFIIPYMKELAFVLTDERADKAKVLTVEYKTIYDIHLQGLAFKQGTQAIQEKEQVNIELLFKKQLPVTK